MTGNFKKIMAVLLISMFVVGGAAYAVENPEGSGIFTKLGRGFTNIVMSPAEIVYQPMKMREEHNAMIAWTGGLLKGIVYFPVRLLLGVYDVVTFPLPWPDHYGYWVEPETLIEGFDGLNYEGAPQT
ncbi:MAG: exosortase system-associated protein, TIGR04073 family [Candidatus Omnitrophica bacterium]|nr:exosortase system-associated protein, TIGR04073 family [Candidatus Omnitrophota bacterium]